MENKQYKIIGKRKSLWFNLSGSLISLAALIFLFVNAIYFPHAWTLVYTVGTVLFIILIYNLARLILIFMIPRNLIAIDGESVIFLQQNITIKFTDIARCGWHRHVIVSTGFGDGPVVYTWGTVFIDTKDGEAFTQKNVGMVKSTAHKLYEIIKQVNKECRFY